MGCTELSQLVVIGESLDFWKNSFGKSQDIAFFFEVKDIIISLKHGIAGSRGLHPFG